jgi:hypothetical protein
MVSVRIWTPESDYDSKAVCCIAQKIVKHYNCDVEILAGTKEAFNTVARHPDGLKKAVDAYLKTSEIVIFLLDADGVQSQAQRLKEKNSLINQVNKVVEQAQGKAVLVLIDKELEAWLLIDCLGICCYLNKTHKIRNDRDWIKFSNKYQPGDTSLITEAESGGKNAKEYLVEFSKKILKKLNPKLKARDLQKRHYSEQESYQIAEYLEINNQTIARNNSLYKFSQHLKRENS